MEKNIDQKHISFALLFGSKIRQLLSDNQSSLTKIFEDEKAKSSLVGFKSWMDRFLVTNYEIYLDWLKHQLDRTSLSYFALPQSDNIEGENIESLDAGLFNTFQFINQACQVVDLAHKEIPESKVVSDLDTAEFKTELLKLLAFLSHKTYENLAQLVKCSFRNTHCTNIYPKEIYTMEMRRPLF